MIIIIIIMVLLIILITRIALMRNFANVPYMAGSALFATTASTETLKGTSLGVNGPEGGQDDERRKQYTWLISNWAHF